MGRPNHSAKFQRNRLITFVVILHTDKITDKLTWSQAEDFFSVDWMFSSNIMMITKTMFMVLSSWQSHCKSSSSSFDECRTAPSGRRPKTKPDDLGCESACTGCQNLHPPLPFIIMTQPESWYSFYRPTEGWVDLAGWLHTETVHPSTDGHPSWYWPCLT